MQVQVLADWRILLDRVKSNCQSVYVGTVCLQSDYSWNTKLSIHYLMIG